MAALKKFVSGVSASTSAYTSSALDASSGRSSFATKWSNVKRRTLESTFHGSDSTEDAEYETRKGFLQSLEKHLLALQKQIKQYLDASRALCAAAAGIGSETEGIYKGAADPGAAGTISDFVSSMGSLDTRLRRDLDSNVMSEVQEPLAQLLASLEVLKSDMRQRELTKVDYDARLRKVNAMKGNMKGAADVATLQHKEQKLQATKDTLDGMTRSIFERFDELENNRVALFGPLLGNLQDALAAFFREGNGALAALAPFPTVSGSAAGSVRPGSGSSSRSLGGGGSGSGGNEYAVPTLPMAAMGGLGGKTPSPLPRPVGGSGAGSTVVTAATTRAEGIGAGSSRGLLRPPSTGSGGAGAVPSAGSRGPAPPPPPHRASTAPVDRVRAVFAYAPTAADELALAVGEVVTVTTRHDDGWCVGETADGRKGAFPLNYTQPA